jgi:hypothetical protein
MLVQSRTEANGHRVLGRLLDQAKVEVFRTCSFGELVQGLKVRRPALALEYVDSAHANHFGANYGGSVFAVPELRATVVRTSGNGRQPGYLEEVFQEAVALHLKHNASTLILDTSDSPANTGLEEAQRFNKVVVAPLAALGLATVLVHVRVDEVACGCERLSSFNVETRPDVFECEADTLAAALTLVRVVTGCFVKPPPAARRRIALTRV